MGHRNDGIAISHDKFWATGPKKTKQNVQIDLLSLDYSGVWFVFQLVSFWTPHESLSEFFWTSGGKDWVTPCKWPTISQCTTTTSRIVFPIHVPLVLWKLEAYYEHVPEWENVYSERLFWCSFFYAPSWKHQKDPQNFIPTCKPSNMHNATMQSKILWNLFKQIV